MTKVFKFTSFLCKAQAKKKKKKKKKKKTIEKTPSNKHTHTTQKKNDFLKDIESTVEINKPYFPRSLNRVFTVRMKKLCIRGYPKYAREESDQTVQMSRLNWSFAGRTCPKVSFQTLRLKCLDVSIDHYENTPIQIYLKFHYQNTENFQIKTMWFFIFLLKT